MVLSEESECGSALLTERNLQLLTFALELSQGTGANVLYKSPFLAVFLYWVVYTFKVEIRGSSD